MTSTPRPGFRLTTQVIVGLLVVAFGLLLTARNIGWLNGEDVDAILRHWPLALVAIGISRILSCETTPARVFGGVVTFVGVWLTAELVYGYPLRFWELWPVLIVVLGGSMIMRALRPPAPPSAAAAVVESSPVYESPWTTAEFAFWSRVERRVTTPAFKRADLTAMMGAIVYDLRQTSPTTPGPAVIDMFVLWGGVEIIVPPDWVVENHVVPILGGVEDGSSGTQGATHRLVLRGAVVMGGVEVKT
jgi:hypothetical protein